MPRLLPVLVAACCLACGPAVMDEAGDTETLVQQLDINPPPIPPIQCSAPEIVDFPLRIADRIGVTIQDRCGLETSNLVQRMQLKIAPWTTVVSLGAMSGTYSVTTGGLSPSTNYCFQVVAGTSGGISLASTTECARTVPLPPPAPTGAVAISKTGTSITLQFSDNSPAEAGFQLVRYTLPEWTETATDFAAVTGTGTREITDTGIDTVTRAYCYRVRAWSFDGIDRGYAASNQACVYLPPEPPTGLSATPQLVSGDHRVSLAWSDASTTEDGFEVQRRPYSGGSWTGLASLAANVESFTDTSPSPETRYCYRVRALRGLSDSYSAEDCTWTHPAVAPAPTGLGASGITQTSATITWNDGRSDESSWRLATPGGTVLASLGSHTGTGSMSHTLTGLSAGSSYTVQVTSERCANSLCARSTAATVSFTTVAPPPPCTPSIRTNCGTGTCPAGYHPIELICLSTDSDGDSCSGDCAGWKNGTRCEQDACAPFLVCGTHTCPYGFTETSVISTPACDPDGGLYSDNATMCDD